MTEDRSLYLPNLAVIDRIAQETWDTKTFRAVFSDPGLRDQPPFPNTVQPRALEVVEPVVAPRNHSEEIVHLRGALLSGRIEWVGHDVGGGFVRRASVRKCRLRGQGLFARGCAVAKRIARL